MKHDQESNSWKHESSFDWTPISKICIIKKDDFIYLLGGKGCVRGLSTPLRDAYRYDITAKKFEKIAEMNEARDSACGAAFHGKIFVIGGTLFESSYAYLDTIDFHWRRTCEVYNETSDEWQVIAGLKIPDWFSQARVFSVTSIDDKLYAVGEYYHRSPIRSRTLTSTRIECYDPDKNEWSKKTEFPGGFMGQACSMRAFKGSEFLRKVSPPLKFHNPSKNKTKCLVM